jgi:hypothetical protein
MVEGMKVFFRAVCNYSQFHFRTKIHIEQAKTVRIYKLCKRIWLGLGLKAGETTIIGVIRIIGS